MARSNVFNQVNRDGDEKSRLVLSSDSRSLRRGRRCAPRTEVCRPCLLWLASDDTVKLQGVVLDLNPYGLRVRSFAEFEEGVEILVQMMRDEEFTIPLSPAIRTSLVRRSEQAEGFVDLGLKIELERIRRGNGYKPKVITRPAPMRSGISRMHTVDVTIDDRGIRRLGRNRE
ncbi:MAG: hypothetical protein HYV27_04545 [Candidatus Hydrogenedentes bacterium]|nr:hypothetical protein [Candidatus Hydrogenedentota bacterium]